MKIHSGKTHGLKKQNGMTFLGFVIIAALALCIVFAGIAVVPAYIEFFSVKKIIQRIGNEGSLDSKSKKEIIEEFNKNANTGYVTVVSGNDLQITKDESGKQVVTIEYKVVKPLAFNLSALMDFKASTTK